MEAQAAGRPVIAFGKGGARETVIDAGAVPPATGVWFAEQSPASLADAVLRFEAIEGDFDPVAIRAHAETFAPERFRGRLLREIAELMGKSVSFSKSKLARAHQRLRSAVAAAGPVDGDKQGAELGS